MSILDRFKKKAEPEPTPFEESSEPELPEDLEQFRLPRAVREQPQREFTTERFPQREEPPAREEKKDFDKLDMIIQKLETIDARLRLLEERLSR